MDGLEVSWMKVESWKSVKSVVRDHLETNARFLFQPTKPEKLGHLELFLFYFLFYFNPNHDLSLTLTKWSLCLNLTRP